MRKPRFIDFHTHPGLKTFFSANLEVERNSCWENVKLPFLLKLFDLAVLHGGLEAQASLKKLNRRRGTIALVGLHAYEKAMLTSTIEIGSGISFSLRDMAKILKIRGYGKLMNVDLLDRICDPDYPYFDILNETRIHVERAKHKWPGYKLLQKIDDYDPCKLNIIFTIEGGHNLFSRTAGVSVRNDVIRNLERLKLSDNRYFFLGLAHMEQNKLCNHAYGLKLFNPEKFIPTKNGITPLGKEVILKALEQPNRILIDIKHMSLKARLEYYELLEDNNLNIPIIASHVGVTGVSYNNMPILDCIENREYNCIKVQYCQPEGLMHTKFNPWSINLYNEEIPTIIASDGIIALNLDERILGTKQKKAEGLIEYFSKHEFNCDRINFPNTQPCGPQEPEDEPTEDVLREYEEQKDEFENKMMEYLQNIIPNPHLFFDYEDDLNELMRMSISLARKGSERIIKDIIFSKDIKHLCNNILHIVKIGGEEAWKHICIGSDLEGLINSVECCRTAAEYKGLRCCLIKWLPKMAMSSEDIVPITNIRQKVNDIMSGNAKRFLDNYFN